VILWTNNRPDAAGLYAQNDTVTGNTIVGPSSTTGAFSVLGTMPGNVVANNTFEAPGAAGEAAAAQTARLAAQATPAAQVAAVPQQPNAPQTSNTDPPGLSAPDPAVSQNSMPSDASALNQALAALNQPAPSLPAAAPSSLPTACTFGN